MAHALQVSEFHSMLGRGARTSTFRVRVRVRVRHARGGLVTLEISHAHGMHVRVGYRLPSPMRGSGASSK